MDKSRILIVDDSEINRMLLGDFLSDDYDIVEAPDGREAISYLKQYVNDVSVVLLDINMPVMDGFEVLAYMNRYHWIDTVPVIMISAETDPAVIRRTYDLGAVDFISYPFDSSIVKHRVRNTIILYARQRKLTKLLVEQLREKEKDNDMMIQILSHIVEFRNGESGKHVLHIKIITKLILEGLQNIDPRYSFSPKEIETITMASALHDIGKIVIPDEILNKPGRLTDEEFAIIKNHSAYGDEMLAGCVDYKDAPLMKVAREIARWHHERWDGRGYPDGLAGDEIPISAQIVALADVYDALTSERCYKAAYSHEKAVSMILGGECGAFNPVIMQCLTEVEGTLKTMLQGDGILPDESDITDIEGILESENYREIERTETDLEREKSKFHFLAENCNVLTFVYTLEPSMLELNSALANALGVKKVYVNPLEDKELISAIGEDNVNAVIAGFEAVQTNEGRHFSANIKLRGSDFDFYFKVIFKGDKKTGAIGRAFI